MENTYILFDNYDKRNEYIESHIWKHIIQWIICLVLPFTITYIFTCFKLIQNYEDKDYIIALGIIIIILMTILYIIYYLLKECERLIKDLKNTRVKHNNG